MNLAIVGATGLVGKKMIEVLQERNIRANFFLFGNEGAGDEIEIYGKKHVVQKIDLSKIENQNLDYALFAVGSDVAKMLVPEFAKRKIKVIDNSSAFRRDENISLVVPQVNRGVLKKSDFVFANPNCSTIQLVTALKPLDDAFGIKRVIVSTQQAVSGAGKEAIDDLMFGSQNKFDHPIQNNIIPYIDAFLPNSYTFEEDKLMFESKKILSRPNLKITATATRVPVLNCHSESVNVSFQKNATLQQVRQALLQGENIVVQDDPQTKSEPMPIYANGRDEVFVGRLRKDESEENAFNMWVVADNLRRGAASNAVDILQELEKL